MVNYCCMRVLLYAKMLKETKTEETIVFFVTFLSLVAFQLGCPGPLGPPSGYAYAAQYPRPFLFRPYAIMYDKIVVSCLKQKSPVGLRHCVPLSAVLTVSVR